MLSNLIKEHQAKQDQLRQENEQRRKAVLYSVEATTNSMMDSVNMGVAKVFANQRRIEVQAVKLQSQTDRFAKQTAQWLQLIENFNQTLKEIGDVENWARAIENDMKEIASGLEGNSQDVIQVVRPPNPAPSAE